MVEFQDQSICFTAITARPRRKIFVDECSGTLLALALGCRGLPSM
jgi:hypothetical protein